MRAAKQVFVGRPLVTLSSRRRSFGFPSAARRQTLEHGHLVALKRLSPHPQINRQRDYASHDRVQLA
jgi:hypothetical protein